MSRIKDLYLSVLSENDSNFFYVDPSTIKSVTDVHYSEQLDYIKIDFNTTYGKPASLVTKFTAFKKWFDQDGKQFLQEDSLPARLPGSVFLQYAKHFMEHSKETAQGQNTVGEIIDQDGNIMPSTDTPKNSTNSMVGANLTWDLEKVYKSSIPKSIRFYSGDLGIGIISW